MDEVTQKSEELVNKTTGPIHIQLLRNDPNCLKEHFSSQQERVLIIISPERAFQKDLIFPRNVHKMYFPMLKAFKRQFKRLPESELLDPISKVDVSLLVWSIFKETVVKHKHFYIFTN